MQLTTIISDVILSPHIITYHHLKAIQFVTGSMLFRSAAKKVAWGSETQQYINLASAHKHSVIDKYVEYFAFGCLAISVRSVCGNVRNCQRHYWMQCYFINSNLC